MSSKVADKAKKSKKSRKGWNRRFKRKIAKSSSIPWYQPQPTRALVKLRYCDVTTITSTSGASNTAQYNISSLYDPDYTFLGHQPYLYDQITSLFNAYCVKSVRIKMKCTACTTPMRVNVYPRFNSSSTTTNLSLGEEYKFSSNFMVGIEGVSKVWNYDIPKIAGAPFETLKNLGAQAIMSASPSASTYWNVQVRTADLTSSGTLAFDLEIEFIAEVSQDLMQAQS